MKLASYSDVKRKILSAIERAQTEIEMVRVDRAHGRISAETVRSKVDLPARPISAMDGYAIRSEETRQASSSNPVRFSVKGSIFPDSSRVPRISSKDAFYVATGSSLPIGATAVVRVEHVRLEGKQVAVTRRIQRMANVSERGDDIRRGQTIVAKERMLTPSDIALLISSGVTHVKVLNLLRVGILSIGNELRRFHGKRPKAGVTYNNYMNLVSGYLLEHGAVPVPVGICPDDSKKIRSVIASKIENLDALITIGGSSVGAKDYTMDALSSLPQSTTVFHGVRLVPIRPAGLVMFRTKPVIVVPGHAVSAALTFFLIVAPVLNALLGLPLEFGKASLMAKATEEFGNSRPIDALYLVKLGKSSGEYLGTPLGWGSNLLENLSSASGYAYLKAGQKISKGESFNVFLLGSRQISAIPTLGDETL